MTKTSKRSAAEELALLDTPEGLLELLGEGRLASQYRQQLKEDAAGRRGRGMNMMAGFGSKGTPDDLVSLDDPMGTGKAEPRSK